MKHDTEYAHGKLTGALHVLVSHPEGIKQRLLEAYELHLSAVHIDDMPEELKKEWNEILERMGKMGASVSRGGEVLRDPIENTIPRIRKKTASQLAEAIDNFHSRLGAYIYKLKTPTRR